MPSRRHTALGRIVALVLLLWTAVDLTNSGLCALENETAPATGSGATTMAAADWDGGASVPTQDPIHVDDCFCCSHCVDVSAIVPTTVVSPVRVIHAALVVPAPRLFGSPLYHPPLSLL
jgi:hypothetical protein